MCFPGSEIAIQNQPGAPGACGGFLHRSDIPVPSDVRGKPHRRESLLRPERTAAHIHREKPASARICPVHVPKAHSDQLGGIAQEIGKNAKP